MGWYNDNIEIVVSRHSACMMVMSGTCKIAQDLIRHPSLVKEFPDDGICEFCDIARKLADQ